MQYLVIMGILIAVAVILIIIIITALVKSRQDDGEKYEDNDEEDDYDDGYDEEAEEAPRHMSEEYDEQREPEQEEGPLIVGQGRRRREGAPAEEGRNRPGEAPGGRRPSEKKLWKLSLENLTSWQKFTFIFYENLGIGRGHSVPQFEKFLSIGDDPRVSKLHCAIIQKEDKLYLKDMGSRNGTYLNGKRVTQPVLLQREDVIGMGETEIEIQSMMREK